MSRVFFFTIDLNVISNHRVNLKAFALSFLGTCVPAILNSIILR